MISPYMNTGVSQSNASKATAFSSVDRTDAPAPYDQPNERGISYHSETSATASEAEAPRSVIRGENPFSKPENSLAPLNAQAAIVDWLNFTFIYTIGESSSLLSLDEKFRKAFGFGINANRNRGHLNYLHSWELGNGFGIFATGGDSVGNTCFFSISGKGCTATRDWDAVHDLLIELKAGITRLDLAHDDYKGMHNIQTALDYYKAGFFFSLHGRPPLPKLIDDFGSGAGKTFYIGSRKNGKLLRVYEKGKANGDPESPWVRWELELHSSNYIIPPIAIKYAGMYLAGSYPCLNWICQEQRHFDSVKQTLSISFDVLKKSCRNSYGKLFWTMKNVLGYSNDEIVEELSVKGVPSRLNMPVVGGGEAL